MPRLYGSYTTRQITNDTFTIEFQVEQEGQWLGYDYINFHSTGVRIITPAGYENTVDGAYAYAGKIFGTSTRVH